VEGEGGEALSEGAVGQVGEAVGCDGVERDQSELMEGGEVIAEESVGEEEVCRHRTRLADTHRRHRRTVESGHESTLTPPCLGVGEQPFDLILG
jgi:hypothetical protein